jgi:heme/copper-type cytochrome/quinol oxidase subunit 2
MEILVGIIVVVAGFVVIAAYTRGRKAKTASGNGRQASDKTPVEK